MVTCQTAGLSFLLKERLKDSLLLMIKKDPGHGVRRKGGTGLGGSDPNARGRLWDHVVFFCGDAWELFLFIFQWCSRFCA